MSAAPANVVGYDVPNGDFCAYLKGFWKRNLEWRRFGASFKHLRSTNNIVFIEEDLDAARQPNTQFLRWSFGRTLKQQDLASAYTVQFIPDEQGTFMEWSFEGVTCHGVFKPEANVAILNFCLQESMVTITYRVLDANTMAVCIVDVDSEHTPTIQYGNIDLEAVHPELQLLKHSDDVLDSPINQFLNDLEQYDTMATAPLVVLLCPGPPPTATRFDAMERKVQSKIEAMQNVTVQSSERLLSLFEQQYRTAFYDVVADKRQHSPYTQAMLNVMSLSLSRQICRLYRTAGSRKKVIVLDCDNTLWGGAVAEVGPSGIDLGTRFLALQRFVIAQQQRGMLLALCSKNILEDVTEAITQRRKDMVLDLDKHVVATKVNWKPKSENIAQLAKELSLGMLVNILLFTLVDC
ncbi:Thymidylate kinase [Phytophthora nicotianae]|uniref:Thymidylate kinase n=1 Tax=Phytophthora nicotianae TaxID=4792 RepID=A0A0W8DIK8_PHYNI|nr:Thymidylate kinase [Phytophthora nicotianae]